VTWSASTVAIAQELTPPRVVDLPDVELDAALGLETVEVRADVRADGTAVVESCAHEAAVCDAVAASIARARFEPATRDGEPIASRVAVRFRVRPPPEPDSPEHEVVTPVEPEPTVAEPDAIAREESEAFGASAVVDAVPRGAMRLSLDEIREVPGAMGDPFRSLDALPGVTPILSGVPYFYVRGAPPAGTIYLYDGVPLPALFHLGAGPSIVHPRLLGDLEFYSSVPPARHGRFTGGVVSAGGPPDETTLAGEIELRLLDANAYLRVPIDDASVEVAGRIGYPGLVVGAISDADLQYWDYQLRARVPAGDGNEVRVLAFGAYDYFSPNEGDFVELHFHRMDARFTREAGAWQLGVGLRAGYERTEVSEAFSVEGVSVGPRIFASVGDEGTQLRVGADFTATTTSLSSEPDTNLDAILDDTPHRSAMGAFAELHLEPVDTVELDLGGRIDAWIAGESRALAFDPRARVTWALAPWISVGAAAGVARQPAVFYAPVPGLSEIAVDRGLQTAIQTELGTTVKLGDELEVELDVFLHHYENLLFLDAVIASQRACDPSGRICREVDIPARSNGLSTGGELFIRRPSEHAFSGWISYTLAWAFADDVAGSTYVPTYDIRHVLNAVASWEIVPGLRVGLRGHLRSGAPFPIWSLSPPDALSIRFERMPPFVRLDAQVSYGWETSWGKLRVELEWFNTTLSREASGLVCTDSSGAPLEPCEVEYVPAIFFPNLGVRAEF
jgi:hypothetical protein